MPFGICILQHIVQLCFNGFFLPGELHPAEILPPTPVACSRSRPDSNSSIAVSSALHYIQPKTFRRTNPPTRYGKGFAAQRRGVEPQVCAQRRGVRLPQDIAETGRAEYRRPFHPFAVRRVRPRPCFQAACANGLVNRGRRRTGMRPKARSSLTAWSNASSSSRLKRVARRTAYRAERHSDSPSVLPFCRRSARRPKNSL